MSLGIDINYSVTLHNYIVVLWLLYLYCILKQGLKHRLRKVGSLEQWKKRSYMLDHHNFIFIHFSQYARHYANSLYTLLMVPMLNNHP